MNILEITNFVRTTDDTLTFLRERGILRALDRPPICPVCGQQMELKRRQSRGDGEVWRCQRRIGRATHKRQVSVRHGSFLEQSNLQPWKFVMLAYFWARGCSNAMLEEFCELSNHTVIDWCNFFRGITSRHLLANPLMLGGIDVALRSSMYPVNNFTFIDWKKLLRILLYSQCGK